MTSQTHNARIALYGGTFDPVHDGHLGVARRLSQLFALDEVLFIPAHVAPHKRRHAAPATPLHRYAMLALATQDEPRFRISTVELDEPEKPYTVETILRLQEKSDAHFLFVMGADSWEEITTWREWEQLLSMVSHVVVTRPGYELNAGHVPAAVGERIIDLRGLTDAEIESAVRVTGESTIYLTDAVRLDISSTQIRRAAQQLDEGEHARGNIQVPPPVAEYINKYRLYREAHETERNDAGRESAHP